MRLWNRARGHTDPPSEVSGVEIPLATKWTLTLCRKCHRVSWFGMPIPHVVTSEEPVEQLVRVNIGRGSSKRMKVTRPLRLMMSKPNKWRCPCGAKGADSGVASTATHVLGMTQYAMRYGKEA